MENISGFFPWVLDHFHGVGAYAIRNTLYLHPQAQTMNYLK